MQDNNKLNIIWFSKLFIDRSSDTATYLEMSKELVKAGNKVILFSSYKKEEKRFNLGDNFCQVLIKNNDVMILNSIIYFFKVYPKLIKLIKKQKPDIIFFEWSIWYLFVPFAIFHRVRMLKAVLCMDIRSMPVSAHSLQLFLNTINYKTSLITAKYFFQGLTVITPYLKQKIIKELKFDSKKIGIWSSGVDTNHFQNSSTKVNKKFTLMYHGVLARGRGIENILLAVKHITGIKDLQIVLIGKNDIKENLDQIIQADNLEDIVVIKGKTDYQKIPSLISECDMGVIPLPDNEWWRASSPLKLLEYLAMGKPVILTDIPAHREVIGENKCGFFTKSESPEDIAIQVMRGYTLRDRLAEIGAQGRNIVENRFRWQIQAIELLKYFKTIMN